MLFDVCVFYVRVDILDGALSGSLGLILAGTGCVIHLLYKYGNIGRISFTNAMQRFGELRISAYRLRDPIIHTIITNLSLVQRT